MSIMIMSRLFRMNLGGCNRKLLAVRLADFADDEGRGIYPGVKRLAAETELSERTVQRILSDFVQDGILVVVQEASGRPGQATRYDFNLDALFGYTPRETGDTLSPVEPDRRVTNVQETGDTGDRDGCHGDTRTVIEPPLEPSTEREARTRDFSCSDGSSRIGIVDAALTKRVQNFCTGQGYRQGEWKGWGGSTVNHIAKQFARLSLAERDAACKWRDAFLAKCYGSKPMPAANYFRDKVWTMFDDADITADRSAANASPAASGGKAAVPVFGPAFGAACAWALISGPVGFDLPGDLRQRVQATYQVHARRGANAAMSYLQKLGVAERDGELVFPANFEAQERARRTIEEGFPEANRLYDAAKARSYVTVSAVFEQMKGRCEAVPVGSPMWERWRDYYERRGWPFGPVPHHQRVVFFPKGGPDGLAEFELAARAIMEQRGDDDAA